MKLTWILLVVSLTAAVSYGAEIRTKADKNIAGVIRKAMDESFRHAMKIGNAELGIPRFDPFVVGHFDVPVKDALSDLSMTIDDLSVENLGLYRIEQLSVDPIDGGQLLMTLANSRHRINGLYTVEGVYRGLPMFSHGPFELAVHQPTFDGHDILTGREGARQFRIVRFTTDTRLLATRFMNIPPTVPRPLLDALRAGENGNANDYMDQVLALVREQVIANGLDHVKLPDGDLSFSMPFWPFGQITGGVFLTGGFMTGMETIHRVGDATLSYEGDIVFFESELGINNGALGYNIAITFLDIGPRGSLTGTLSYANFQFKARIDLLAGEVVVEYVDIKDIGHISTEITGLGIFNWLAELIADLAINLLKGIIKELIQGPIKAIINNVLHSVIDMFRPTTAAALVAAKMLV